MSGPCPTGKSNSPLVILYSCTSFSHEANDALRTSVSFLLVPGVNGGIWGWSVLRYAREREGEIKSKIKTWVKWLWKKCISHWRNVFYFDNKLDFNECRGRLSYISAFVALQWKLDGNKEGEVKGTKTTGGKESRRNENEKQSKIEILIRFDDFWVVCQSLRSAMDISPRLHCRLSLRSSLVSTIILRSDLYVPFAKDWTQHGTHECVASRDHIQNRCVWAQPDLNWSCRQKSLWEIYIIISERWELMRFEKRMWIVDSSPSWYTRSFAYTFADLNDFSKRIETFLFWFFFASDHQNLLFL